MHQLSELAKVILERMQPDRVYEPPDLRALLADASVERLREVMHELWINRQVERVGYSGWRRHLSAPPHRPRQARREVQVVKPEDLFDHDAFAEFFK
jgi:hypothetical protein